MKTDPTTAGFSKSSWGKLPDPLMGFLCPVCGSWRTEVRETWDRASWRLFCFACGEYVKINLETARSVHDADYGRSAENVE